MARTAGINDQIAATATLAIRQRFWSQVEKSRGCWLYQGYVGPTGYGIFCFGGCLFKAHRLSLLWARQKTAPFALHKCMQKACVRRSHLYWGTQADNNRDQIRDKTHANKKGNLNGRAKIQEEDLQQIWHLFFDLGETTRNIASLYSVATSTVAFIVRKETWRHVTADWSTTCVKERHWRSRLRKAR